ncbi:MAG TPA: DUF86 domain-containing protein [Thermoanaerobaculia bacterium]
MALRVEALSARLAKLDEIIALLREFCAIDRSVLKDSPRDMLGVERALQLGAELILDIGNHALSAQYGVHATSYKEIVRLLGRQGVISESLAARLEKLGGFRNVLVHGYMDLDPEVVLDHLYKAPGDFSDFMAEIRTWLEGLALQP